MLRILRKQLGMEQHWKQVVHFCAIIRFIITREFPDSPHDHFNKHCIYSSSTRQKIWASGCSTKQSLNSIQDLRQANQAVELFHLLNQARENVFHTDIKGVITHLFFFCGHIFLLSGILQFLKSFFSPSPVHAQVGCKMPGS